VIYGFLRAIDRIPFIMIIQLVNYQKRLHLHYLNNMKAN